MSKGLYLGGVHISVDVYALCLRKGDMCAIAVRAVATADGNSYIQLLAVPEVLEDED